MSYKCLRGVRTPFERPIRSDSRNNKSVYKQTVIVLLPWPSSDVHVLAKLKCPPGLPSVDPQTPIQTSSRNGLTLAER